MFKNLYQESPAAFIKHKKLEKAAQLLQLSTDSITQIAFDSGFTNSENFSKAFKQKYGHAPMDYRKTKLN